MRSRLIDDLTESEIKCIASRGTWQTISHHRMMKYNASSVYPSSWRTPKMTALFNNIKSLIFDRHLPSKDYQFGRHNLLKNGGVMHDDQVPHFDYKPL